MAKVNFLGRGVFRSSSRNRQYHPYRCHEAHIQTVRRGWYRGEPCRSAWGNKRRISRIPNSHESRVKKITRLPFRNTPKPKSEITFCVNVDFIPVFPHKRRVLHRGKGQGVLWKNATVTSVDGLRRNWRLDLPAPGCWLGLPDFGQQTGSSEAHCELTRRMQVRILPGHLLTHFGQLICSRSMLELV